MRREVNVSLRWFYVILLIFFIGRSYEYDERDPAALLLERGIIPDYEGEHWKVFSI